MFWLIVLLQFLIYGALMYVFYRYVYKTAIENRKAALTEKPEGDDYVPETVDAAFIAKVSGGRDRGLRTKREYDLAGILENWNQAEFTTVESGVYDDSVGPIISLLEAKPMNKDRKPELRQHLWLTYRVEPQNLDGMYNYLHNWIRLNP